VSGRPCDIKLAGIHFTKAVNGADTLAKTDAQGRMDFRVGAKKDFFCDPNDNKLSNNTAPILLAKVDNTKPFTLVAKVTPGFTAKGLYNAGVLYVYVNDRRWQKHCFEQDERGRHRIVSVRTLGTSDDNNHDVVTAPTAYMKISSDTRTVASYYSLDKKTWQLVRLYKNDYPAELWAGVSAQCPIDTGTTSHFEDISLTQNSVSDFRLGN
jgi:regulation of enolase protein 1 (concanavalin A-like superfamily)